MVVSIPGRDHTRISIGRVELLQKRTAVLYLTYILALVISHVEI